MSDPGSDLQRAAHALARARERIVALEQGRAAPVAIVGVGLRLPGDIDSPDALWSALTQRSDLTGPVPEDRREELAGIAAAGLGAAHGAWLAGIDRFDAERFGVSPREAATMDPQHRLLLETCLAATERAGLRDEELRGSRTGVYVGLCNNDYALRLLREPGDPRVDASLGTGNCYSMAAGRIAYSFGLTGPAFALDSACASSLLAVQLGVQAIRSGECERAIVGGVNLVLSVNPSLAFARMGVLSPSGRCRAMDASADGYLRAEGCVVFVLEDLARARAAGRPIVAVIRGCAARQNGAGNGIVAPNPAAQEAVIRAALRDASVAPAAVGMIAAFGAGTVLGDLAELTALERVFADRRTPLWLGLCKPNFGHAEGAAGATSLLLACEAIARRQVPPALLDAGPSPRLPWSVTRLADRLTPWDDDDRVAGVSAFGFNGTNVHVILAAPPTSQESPESPLRTPTRVPLSARCEPLLRAHAGELALHLRAHPELSHAGVLATLTRGRTLAAIATSLAADDRDTLLVELDRLTADTPLAPAIASPAIASAPLAPAIACAAMVALPPRPLARQRHWTDLIAAPVPHHDTGFPELELLRAAPREPRQAAIARALARSLTRALGREVAPDDRLGSLALDSLLAVDLLARVREAWGLTVFPGELFAQPTVQALAAHLSALMDGPDATRDSSLTELEHALPASLRRGRPAPVADEPTPDPSLPPPIFLLSTPRTGSTLLRAMLGGHPALFAPPELHLLAFADLADWRDALAPDLLQLGLHQALGGLGWSEPEVASTVASWAAERLPIARAYDALRAAAAPRRLLDKSPSYALDPQILTRAARLFPQAHYIHLVRHPVPSTRSFVQRRMGRLLGLNEADGPRAASQVWTIGNRNLLGFLATLPPGRALQVRYEDLVRDPPTVLARICRFLELEYSPPMTDPHARRFPGEERGVIGDPGFYARKGVDAALADRWRDDQAPGDLSAETAALAARLGYEVDDADATRLAAIRLDPAITPTLSTPRTPQRLLLTGATGFLGPWLLRALQHHGHAEIVALVRARDDADATRRLHTALAALPDQDLTRVRAIAGHLDRPRLGLADDTWRSLADSVDLVVHNGAAVNFARGWQELAAANISGTEEALRLACAGRPTAFVHVSTKGILDPAVYTDDAPIGEDDPLRPPEGPLLGYQRSKWAAESLVRQAAARGLPVAVCRPGRIGGDLATGGMPESDFMVLFLRGCLEIAALPRLEYAIEVTPVDVVAAAIATICARPELLGKTYHLTHPRPIELAEVAPIAAEFGLHLELLPYTIWRDRLLTRAAGPGSALAPLLSMFPAHEPARIDDRRLRHSNTEAALAGTDIVWPAMSGQIRASLAFMLQRGLL
ncbi:thioester reductase domain-containing protein [Nannocystis sp.]|uniref:thioester reductase domain-containing protein n=1 Tax=Nannocystis sp. TaxID=1962667 RepID=UPI0025CE2D98|nr:thioester reductase domain-containing protein [Nannocystis sp.]MBK7826994.1 thioester reductase domain-containing protein [Nannocystis sp.]